MYAAGTRGQLVKLSLFRDRHCVFLFRKKRRQREIEEGFAGEGVLIRGKGSFVLAPPSPIWRANNVCVSVPFVDSL